MLCDSLKDRVSFFVTQYIEAHGNHGRACIVVDGKEIFNMSDLTFNVAVRKKEIELLQNPSSKEMFKKSTYWEANELIAQSGVLDEDHFFEAINQYFYNSIEDSLNSENIIVVVLAILDRRIGKRT